MRGSHAMALQPGPCAEPRVSNPRVGRDRCGLRARTLPAWLPGIPPTSAEVTPILLQEFSLLLPWGGISW